MSRPTRATPGGQAYLALRARARSDGRPTDELFVLYVLERFLYRLSISEHRDRLVLKGGMLLAAFDERRPTGDVDLLARSIANDVETLSDIVRQVLAVPADDGVTFDVGALRSGVIRDAELYSGVRIVVPAGIDRARHPLRVDINVGDPITPGPIVVNYPALLDEPFSLVGYPMATVLAEKIVTMIDRGDTTTRDRDFADVYLLSGRHPIPGAELAAAIAVDRGAPLGRTCVRSERSSSRSGHCGRRTGPGSLIGAGSPTPCQRTSLRSSTRWPTSPTRSSPATSSGANGIPLRVALGVRQRVTGPSCPAGCVDDRLLDPGADGRRVKARPWPVARRRERGACRTGESRGTHDSTTSGSVMTSSTATA